MDIGKEERTIVVEPVKDPVPVPALPETPDTPEQDPQPLEPVR